MNCSMPGFPVLHCLLEFAQTHVHWVSDAIQPSHPLSPHSPPARNLSHHQSLLQWVDTLHQVAKKYWSFSFSIRAANEHSGLSFFKVYCFYLLTIQETVRSLQHHSCKTSILWHSTLFMIRFSHSYMTTGKTIALTIWTFVHKTMYLLFLYAVKVDTVFLSRSKSF